MEILFGKLSPDMLESMDTDDCPPFELDEEFYEFKLIMGTDTISIKDSLGRYVPFSPEDMKSLFKAVRIAKAYSKAIVEYNEVETELSEGYVFCV